VREREREYQRFGVQQSCGEITIWEFTILSCNEHSHADCCSNRVVIHPSVSRRRRRFDPSLDGYFTTALKNS
jgi:hypothetical protein